MAAGKAPYAGVEMRTRGELLWVMQERRWSGELIWPAGYERAYLVRADLRSADLSGAVLLSANLIGANLSDADLSGANLRAARMDATTSLRDARLDTHTRLADVVWNGVPLTRLNWEDVTMLGDEQVARQPNDRNGRRKRRGAQLRDYADAVLANRQVATVLRSQGLNEHADRFAYRAQLCQRRLLRLQRHYLRYLGSLFLGLIAGYGYRPLRSVATYLAVVLGFAVAYFALGGVGSHHTLTWNEAIVVSMTAFHGRGFFATAFQPGDPQAAVAAVEAVFGLLIEITFIATFTQRFFAR